MTDDLQTIYSYDRFSGDHSYHQSINVWEFYVVPLQDKQKLRSWRKYVQQIAEITFDKYVESARRESISDENCLDCGLCVNEICSKCKPNLVCHYCGGYDGNYLRNENFPCIAFCTPSSRLICGYHIRPLAVHNPYSSLQTTSYSEGIYCDGRGF